MNIRFKNKNFQRLYEDVNFFYKLDASIIKAYRKKVQILSAASDLNDLKQLKSLHLEKLKQLQPYYSIRLNSQWRLIIQIQKANDETTIEIIDIRDYH